MLQDLEVGKALEIDGMLGVVIELGEQTDTPTPAMNTVFALVSLLNKTVQEEGIKIAIETIQQLKEIEGVRGVHVMAIEWEEKVPEIVQEAGLYPRPQLN